METTLQKPFMSPTKILVAALLVTGLAIYAYTYLPHKSRTLVPSNDLISFYVDSTGHSQIQWLDQEKRKFRCTYSDSPSNNRFCGMNIQQGDGLTRGVDLSSYNEMELHIEYTGNAEVMRLYVRNYTPSLAKIESADGSAKYINTRVPVEELKSVLTVKLEDLAIPEWWVLHSGIPREHIYSEFNNVIHIGVDIPFPAPLGNHDIELKYIKLKGIYLSQTAWYLLILSIWGAALLLIIFKRELKLRQKTKRDQQRLTQEKTRAARLKQISESYKELSNLDTLSGIFNRRGIHQFYENCIEEESKGTGSIIMLDIDHFKKINDTYGHGIGDIVIQTMGEILRKCIREQDNVGRWGGEEFLILCINTSLKGAIALAEKIRCEVESYQFEDIPALTMTVSLGVSVIASYEGFEQNVKLADDAMYKAKESGRNCWVAHEDEQ